MDDQAALSEQRKALIAGGHLIEARQLTARMLKANPSDPQLLNQMAWVMAALKDFRGAIAHQERAIQCLPNNPTFHHSLLRYLERRAEQVRAKAEHLAPSSVEAFALAQEAEKTAVEKRLKDILSQCLEHWPHRIDFDTELKKQSLLRDHLLDTVPRWVTFIPEKYPVGSVAEIAGIGSFVVGHPLPLQRRLARGMPWELPIAIMLMEFAMRANPNSVIVDIGANIGTLTVPLALNFAGQILAFEPVDATLMALEKNLQLNNITNVRVLKKACSAAPGLGEMIDIDERNTGGAKLDVSQSGTTDVTTLDTEVARLGAKVSLIKMDVEGHEGPVFDGAHDVLRNHRPLIVCELWGENRQPIFEKLKPFGYEAAKLFRSDFVLYPT